MSASEAKYVYIAKFLILITNMCCLLTEYVIVLRTNCRLTSKLILSLFFVGVTASSFVVTYCMLGLTSFPSRLFTGSSSLSVCSLQVLVAVRRDLIPTVLRYTAETFGVN